MDGASARRRVGASARRRLTDGYELNRIELNRDVFFEIFSGCFMYAYMYKQFVGFRTRLDFFTQRHLVLIP